MAWIPIAAAVAGGLVGGLTSKQGGPQQIQQQSVSPWEPSIPYLTDVLQRYQNYANSPLPYSSPGAMVAPLTDPQNAAVGTVQQGVQGGQALNTQAQTGIQPFLSGQFMNAETNPYLQAAIAAAQRPVTQNYQENVLPAITTQFSQNTDAYDQSREGIAKGIASRGYLNTLGDISAGMSNQNFMTGQGATLNAIGQVPNLTTAATAPGQAQWNIGALLQGQNQNVINAAAAYDALQQQRLAQAAQIYGQVGQIGRQGTAWSPGVSGNPYLGAVGGAILGSQAYNMWRNTPTPTPTPTPNPSDVPYDSGMRF